MDQDTKDWENQWRGAGGASGVMVAEVLSPKLKPYEGKTIADIATAEKKDPRDVVIDIVLADRANAYCIISIMDEKDVRAALASPLVTFCTDSQAKATDGPFGSETSHPRGWGSATRILGYYVRDEKLLRLEEAVRKMTSFAAEAAGLRESRPSQGGLLGRSRDLRPEDRERARDLREAQSVQRGNAVRRGQRRTGRRRGQGHGRRARQGAARTGVPTLAAGSAPGPFLSQDFRGRGRRMEPEGADRVLLDVRHRLLDRVRQEQQVEVGVGDGSRRRPS